MNTILVVTFDDELSGRVSRALARDGEITRLMPGDSLPPSRGESAPFVVLDVRDRLRIDALADLSRYRVVGGIRARCVAIAASDRRSIDVVTTLGDEVVSLVLADAENLESVIRAHVNDQSRSAAAATACDVALELLPTATHETIRVLLGGGFRVSSVKQLAAHYGTDRTSLGKALRKVTDWTSKDIIDAAKASYAAMLLRQTALAPHAIANAVAFGKPESLDCLLKRTFELAACDVREHERNLGARGWLERELAAFISRRSDGRKEVTAPTPPT